MVHDFVIGNSAKLLLQNLDADKLLNQFGKYGRYQLFVYAMFGITCESSGILDHANGVFMIGNFMAAPFSTYLADRYGRRLTF
uniref:Major facilitator superfamily (MFS) profile domain-containing protein n=1 Tax=Meloidogyne floridensis TaxID=298350 RepID=A0A915NZX9_9BILA